MIVATAGHVDHGKTELVKALTGIDTDRLPEEKQRGLSIDLGFAYRPLAGCRPLGFVDVPGHEKFVRNMLAGVGGIDLGLLVVAADDGVMPQTREHFAILDLLGVKRCLVAITKIDRVDDDRVLQVRDQVETLVGSSGQTGVSVFPVCAPDYDGIEPLQQALEAQARNLQTRAADGYFRLAIDRSFSPRGVGLVVTGMVFAGCARIDDELLLSADGKPVRVRGIRALDQPSEQASAGERCALNIVGRGIGGDSLSRGDWLLHPRLRVATRRIDVDLRVLESEPRPLKHWTPVQLHLGADRFAARTAIIEGGSIAAGERGLAQLVLARDAFVSSGDRFVLRDQSARRTMAGGRVIDPFAPKRGRARPERRRALQALRERDAGAALAALVGSSDSGVALEPFAIARNLTDARIEGLVESLRLRRLETEAGARVFCEDRWQNLLDRIETSVDQFHDDRPTQAGASPEDIQFRLQPRIDRPVITTATADLVKAGRLGQRGARFHRPDHVMFVSERDQELLQRATNLLAPASGSPPSLQQAAEALRVDKEMLETALKQAAKTGEMVLLSTNRYVPLAYLAHLAGKAEILAAQSAENSFGVAEYCAQAGTGRNFAIDLLEYFDRRGFTRRSGNRRHVLRAAAELFTHESRK